MFFIIHTLANILLILIGVKILNGTLVITRDLFWFTKIGALFTYVVGMSAATYHLNVNMLDKWFS